MKQALISKHQRTYHLLILFCGLLGFAPSLSFAQMDEKARQEKEAATDTSETGIIKTPTLESGAEPEGGTASTQQNNRMRALEGSRSPWSLQAQLSYSGSTIVHPFSEFVPNPGGEKPPPVVKMSGLIQGRYRIDERQSLGAGLGVTAQKPFQGFENPTAADPTFDYAFSTVSGSLHNRAGVTLSFYTNENDRKYHYAQGLSLSDDAIWALGQSGVTLGLSSSAYVNTFDGDTLDGSDVRAQQTDYGFGLYPLAEYQMTRRLNLRSVVGFRWEHTRDREALKMDFKRIYQTFGLGVSATDDIFFYFFLQFYPSPLNEIRNENTTVGFSAIINLF